MNIQDYSKVFYRLYKQSKRLTAKFILFFFRKNNTDCDKLLILRLDSIGDYILFRDYIEKIKYNSKYSNYKLYLCGNVEYKEIAEYFESSVIDGFIWVNLKQYYSSFLYRFNIYRIIYKESFKVIINPVYSRSPSLDKILYYADANEIIGQKSDLSRSTKEELDSSDQYFTKLIDTGGETIFEYSRTKIFFENILDKSLIMSKPFMDVNSIKVDINPEKDFVVLFPFASDTGKLWSIEKFTLIADYLVEKYKLNVIILGAKNDHMRGEIIRRNSKYPVLNLCGKYSLVEVAKIISLAKLLISNDTCAVHIGAAVNTKVISINNGQHYGRFSPYPRDVFPNIIPLYPPVIRQMNKEDIEKEYKYKSLLNINEISFEDLQCAVNKMMENE